MSLMPDSFSPFYGIDRKYIEESSFPQKMRDTFVVFFGEREQHDSNLFNRFINYSTELRGWKKAGLLDYALFPYKAIENVCRAIYMGFISLGKKFLPEINSESSVAALLFSFVSTLVYFIAVAALILLNSLLAVPRFIISGVLTGLSMPLVAMVHWCIQKPNAQPYVGGQSIQDWLDRKDARDAQSKSHSASLTASSGALPISVSVLPDPNGRVSVSKFTCINGGSSNSASQVAVPEMAQRSSLNQLNN